MQTETTVPIIDEPLKCPKCKSTQMMIQKTGFNGTKAVKRLVTVVILLSIVWCALIVKQEGDIKFHKQINDITGLDQINQSTSSIIYQKPDIASNKYLIGGTIAILALSLLYGFSGSDKNKRVCIKCGNSELLTS